MRNSRSLVKPAKVATGIILAVGILSAIGWSLYWFPQQQVKPLKRRIAMMEAQEPKTLGDFEKLAQQEKARIDAENSIRAPLIQATVGILTTVAGSTAAYIAFRNYRATQEKNVADRFTKAAEMLGHDKMDVRLGGIFALEQIANTEDKYYWQIMEILTAYVRVRSPWSEESTPVKYASSSEIPALPIDIQTIMTVVSRRKHSYHNGEEFSLNLRHTDLRRLQLTPQARLQGINFRYTCLVGADMPAANLEGADLCNACLDHADLQGANLSEATLRQASMRSVVLNKANLNDADLYRANLSEACLDEAHLERALLKGSQLQDTSFDSAFLQGANLQHAHLERSTLQSAQLEKTNFKSAYLMNAILSQTNCFGAIFTGANLEFAKFDQAILDYAEFGRINSPFDDATNLTQGQIDYAKSHEKTTFPTYW